MKRSLAALLALVAVPATALAVLPAGGGTVDLATTFDGKLRGDVALLGNVSGVGDFNADKGADMAVVQKDPRAIRVVHGGALDGERGFNAAPATVISSASRAVTAVAGAGDVNGDGIADLVVGSCTPGTSDAGRAWVVFGRAGTAAIDLDAATFGGFVVDGAAGDCLGRSVSGAGDFNGDGKADVVIGASEAQAGKGRAIVVFGKADQSPAAAGLEMVGPSGSLAGTHVAGLGDVNGDGKADVGVGAANYDDNATVDAGAVFVVHGRAAGGTIALDSLGATGFRIVGGGDGAHLSAVAPAGDTNKDGKADVAVGAPGPNIPGVVGVVFGRTETTQLNTGGFDTAGYRFTSSTGAHRFGFDVRGGADLNGDGIPDVVAGAPDAPVGANPQKLRAGKAFVLYGRTAAESPVNVDSADFAARGVTILGTRGEESGAQTQDPTLIGFEGWIGLGDVNCDGAADVLLGSGVARLSGGGTDPGAVWIQRGPGGGPSTCTGAAAPAPTPAPTVAPTGKGEVVRILKAKLKNTRLRVGRRPTAIASAKAAPFGTVVRFELSEPATVRFRITCSRPKGKQKAFCKKLAKKDTLTRKVRTGGATTLSFTGRIAKKPLVLGSYAMTLVATDADGSSAPKALKFKVVKR